MMFFLYHQRSYYATDISLFVDDPNKDELLINNTPIKKVETFDFLGVTLHKELNWIHQTNKIASKIGKNIGMLHKLKHFLPKNVMILLYNSLIHSYLNNGILVWGFNPGRLVSLQKKAIRAITSAKYNSHTSKSFKSLKILTIADIFTIRCLKFYFSIQNLTAPVYFREQFSIKNYNPVGPTGPTRTQGASKCLHVKLLTDIVPNFDRLVLDKTDTHSYEGFSKYAKQYLISKYQEECTAYDYCEDCYPCRQTLPEPLFFLSVLPFSQTLTYLHIFSATAEEAPFYPPLLRFGVFSFVFSSVSTTYGKG